MPNLKSIKAREAQNKGISLSMNTTQTNVAIETSAATQTTCGTIMLLPNWTTTTSVTTTTTTTPETTNSRNSKNQKIQFSRTSKETTTTAIPTKTTTATATATCYKNCTISNKSAIATTTTRQFVLVAIFLLLMSINGFFSLTLVKAENFYASTTPMNLNGFNLTTTATASTTVVTTHSTDANDTLHLKSSSLPVHSGSGQNQSAPNATTKKPTASFFKKLAKQFSTGNELWDGIISDCYEHPTFSCFQKNVYSYLSDALSVNDVNVTQRLKFYRNQLDYNEHQHRHQQQEHGPTESAVARDVVEAISEQQQQQQRQIVDGVNNDDHLLRNEIPRAGRAVVQSPIEEVSNALYGKSIKFAMTHDMELKLPEMFFDGATFRISPRSIEGNGIIAKLEFIPKQEVEARLAGKILMNKIKKFLRSKLLLSFVALLLIIKIIKIKFFWLLPIVIGVGAAKKLLLKFLLFLFPALSHLFKLCSYYQQTYHSTKYHHHHHLINHHHTVVPAWHSNEHHQTVPELIFTNPPKGHPSTYLHGAPIHETYGPPSSHEHFEGGWENSGPGLGSEYISDVNRVAQIDGNSNYFKPHTTNDANVLHAWGLGTTQSSIQQQQQQQQQQQRKPATQQQRPPIAQNKQQKPHSTSHSFNPFVSPDKQSIFTTNLRPPTSQLLAQQSMPSPVYTPPRNAGNQIMAAPANVPGLTASQIAAQYDPTRNNAIKQQQPQQSPELSAQLKEAIRIQAEQRIIAQQQKILENQPFVQDGQPIMPKNYDPFYSPILVKIDKIIEQLGVTDDLCKERLVCSMYKDPNRYSPHSNFISAELSRDTNELQPVKNNNQAVVRFYRLIQAARDGQDQKDCLRLYAQCNINTE